MRVIREIGNGRQGGGKGMATEGRAGDWNKSAGGGERRGTRGGVGGKNRGRIGTSRQMFSFYAYTVPFLN